MNHLHEFNRVFNHWDLSGQDNPVLCDVQFLHPMLGGGLYYQVQLRVFGRITGHHHIVRIATKEFPGEFSIADRIADCSQPGPNIQRTPIVAYRCRFVACGNQQIGERCIVPSRFRAAQIFRGEVLHAAWFVAVFSVTVSLSNGFKVLVGADTRAGLCDLIHAPFRIHPQGDVVDKQVLGINPAGEHRPQSAIAQRQRRLYVAQAFSCAFLLVFGRSIVLQQIATFGGGNRCRD